MPESLVLSASGVTRRLRSSRWEPGREFVLGPISLEVMRGEIVAIVGPSGAGKSSLGRILAGLDPADSGEIRVHDSGSAPKSLRSSRGRVQYVFQAAGASLNPRLLIREVLSEGCEALGLMRATRDRNMDALLLELALEPDVLDRRSDELSTGQRHRLALARAVLAEPLLLVLDEPFSAEDMIQQARTRSFLRRRVQERGLGSLVISHDLPGVACLADRILVMHEGRIVEEGLTRDVLAEPRDPITRRLIEGSLD